MRNPLVDRYKKAKGITGITGIDGMKHPPQRVFDYIESHLKELETKNAELKQQLTWHDATKETPEERLIVVARTKSKFYEPHSGRAFWDIVMTYIRDGEWQDIDSSFEVMEWLPIPKEIAKARGMI